MRTRPAILAYAIRTTCVAFLLLAATAATLLSLSSVSAATSKKSKPAEAITRTELQALLMSFADRYLAITDEYLVEYFKKDPPSEEKEFVNADAIGAYFDVVSLAASPNPDVALIDMVVMVTLKRMIYEEHWRKQYGASIDGILEGMRLLERDIWDIADQVLSKEEQKELMAVIRRWRKEHPEITAVSWLRFYELAEDKFLATLVKKARSRGLLPEVDKAARQIEESRQLAERVVYLASRYPLLFGIYSDFWLSQWLKNPGVSKLTDDLHTFSESSKRLGNLAEKLPEIIRAERAASVDHLMDRVAKERKEFIGQLAAEEKRLGGILGDLRQTVTAANELVKSSDALAQRFGIEPESPSTFDIKDYRKTIEQATIAIRELDALIQTMDQTTPSAKWEKLFPIWVKYFDDVERTGTNLIDYAMVRVVWVIIITVVVVGLATLFVRLVTKKHLHDA